MYNVYVKTWCAPWAATCVALHTTEMLLKALQSHVIVSWDLFVFTSAYFFLARIIWNLKKKCIWFGNIFSFYCSLFSYSDYRVLSWRTSSTYIGSQWIIAFQKRTKNLLWLSMLLFETNNRIYLHRFKNIDKYPRPIINFSSGGISYVNHCEVSIISVRDKITRHEQLSAGDAWRNNTRAHANTEIQSHYSGWYSLTASQPSPLKSCWPTLHLSGHFPISPQLQHCDGIGIYLVKYGVITPKTFW